MTTPSYVAASVPAEVLGFRGDVGFAVQPLAGPLAGVPLAVEGGASVELRGLRQACVWYSTMSLACRQQCHCRPATLGGGVGGGGWMGHLCTQGVGRWSALQTDTAGGVLCCLSTCGTPFIA